MKCKLFKRAVSVALSVALSIVALTSCSLFQGGSESEQAQSQDAEGNINGFKLSVKSEDKNDLIWAGSTGKEGDISFNADASKSYIAILSDVKPGYEAKPEYQVTENTEILLETVLGEPDYKNDRYKLGDIAKDMSLTDVNGKSYKLFELVKEKKAVVINLWFIGCDPCKREFPYLQEAYSEYKNDIEILAINPCDGTNATVKGYAEEMGLTFPIFSVGGEWATMFNTNSYPTTVVIDKYGMIAFAHSGSITDKEIFAKIFANFISEDYIQKTYRNLSDIIQ